MYEKYWNNLWKFTCAGCTLMFFGVSLYAGKAQIELKSGMELGANPNSAVPLAAVLTFDTKKPVDTKIEIFTGNDCRVLEYGPRSTPSEGLPVIGFSPGVPHQVRVTLMDPKNKQLPLVKTFEFSAPDLPEKAEKFPIIEVNRVVNTLMEPGVTLFNPRRRIPMNRLTEEQAVAFQEGFGLLVAIDSGGNVLWYYSGESRISDFELLKNGNILFLTQDYRAVEIDLLGNTVSEWYASGRPKGRIASAIPVDTTTFHHDIDELSNGNFLVLGSECRKIPDYYTSEYDEQAPRQDQWVMGDELIEFTREGEVVWRWSAFDYLDVSRIGYETFRGYWKRRGFPDTIDWSHANSVVPLGNNWVLVNYRYQSAITKVNRNDGEIKWIAGNPDGWKAPLSEKLLEMEGDSEWFWHQHSPSMTSRGTLLVFDNANYQAQPFDEPTPPGQTRSRMVEYVLDEENGTLSERWSSIIPDDPAVVSYAMGSTQYLRLTGNLLAGYGMLLSQEEVGKSWQAILQGRVWTRVREYTNETPTRVAWELTLKARENDFYLGWSLFGAKRIITFPQRRKNR